tara:strand:+ start:95 stop:511 length:417 start_codon:yes stop_codon:yes gene_type:complete
MGLKKLLFISFLLLSCNNQNKKNIDIGNISILDYPKDEDLKKWVQLDSQYARVFQVRKYFENFVNDNFFEEKENKKKYNNLTWSNMLKFQKKYADLLNKYQKQFKDSNELTKVVDSLIFIEFPLINEFTSDIFNLDYN